MSADERRELAMTTPPATGDTPMTVPSFSIRHQHRILVRQLLFLARLQGQSPDQLVPLVDAVDALFPQHGLRVGVGADQLAGEPAADDERDLFLAVVVDSEGAFDVRVAVLPAADVNDVPAARAVGPLRLLVLDRPGADGEGLLDPQHGLLAGVGPVARSLAVEP